MNPNDQANRGDPDQLYSWVTAWALLSPTTAAAMPGVQRDASPAAHVSVIGPPGTGDERNSLGQGTGCRILDRLPICHADRRHPR